MQAILPNDVAVTTRTIQTTGGRLPVGVIDLAGGVTRTYIVAMGYAAWLDEFEVQRFRLLAQELRARLIVVETPGHGPSATHLTFRERWELAVHAGLRPVAARMLDAAAQVEPSILTAPVGVVGYSLGSSMAAAIATELRERTGGPASALVLVEPVAGRPWRLLDLAHATRTEDVLVDDALAQNADVPGAVAPWDRRPTAQAPHHNQLDLFLYVNALRSGRLGQQVLETGVRRVVVVRGKDSRLSLATAVADIVNQARAAGIEVAELVMLGTHGLWHSLPSVRRLGQFVAESLEGPQ